MARASRRRRHAIFPNGSVGDHREVVGFIILTIVPTSLREASRFITEHHRHHRPPQGMKFALGVAADGVLVGVAVVGRPVTRHLDDRATLEVTRSCTDGTPNANSKLYGAAWRAARALGYHRLVTYTEEGESGASLRAAGFRPVGVVAPHAGWDRPNRSWHAQARAVTRTRWELITAGYCRPDTESSTALDCSPSGTNIAAPAPAPGPHDQPVHAATACLRAHGGQRSTRRSS
ncbi:XF1762 family protein [Streptomyces albicerus]|uniref:XF1762 family protein n=1 Tax=Streptomyces albicerus TaxID=2569859 RepID=UPI00385081C1